ncbi:hypothetical protein LCGC14_0303340 [marine sediment metagenome]|uniref:Uncharacterized protein n=1 Tax=marine sediment metagenome TaxID=412755 RepID=A0A0F9WVU5_9ZZZZ
MIELPLLGRKKRKAIAISKIEYTEQSCNPIFGCSHACTYCFSRKQQVRYKQAASNADWHKPKMYDDFLIGLQEQIDAGQVKKDKEIFVSTMTDVYQPAAVKYDVARKILIKLQDAGLIYRLLTKSPEIVRDIDILDGYEKGIAGLSITTNISNDKQRKRWEPRTRSIKERLDALKKMSEHDIRLWSSVEPILPETNITSMLDELLEHSQFNIEQIMIGKMNYQAGVDDLIDWEAAINVIEGYKSKYPDIYWHYKKETVAYLEKKGII